MISLKEKAFLRINQLSILRTLFGKRQQRSAAVSPKGVKKDAYIPFLGTELLAVLETGKISRKTSLRLVSQIFYVVKPLDHTGHHC